MKYLVQMLCIISLVGILSCEKSDEGGDSTDTPPKVSTPEIQFVWNNTDSKYDVTIDCSTAGAEIYYSIDGSVPSTVYSAFQVACGITIRAKSVKTGFTDSDIAEVTTPVELVFYNFDSSTSMATRNCEGLLPSSMSLAMGTIAYYAGNPDTGKSMSGNEWQTTANYFQFTLDVNSDTLVLMSLEFDDYASTTGPKTWEIRSSSDSYGTCIDSGTTDNAFTNTPMHSIDLKKISGTGPITIRLYGSGAIASGGTWRIDNVRVLGYIITGK